MPFASSECTIARAPAAWTIGRFPRTPSIASILNPPQSDQMDAEMPFCARMSAILYASTPWWNERIE
jgi:hypothetical protein